jgi:plasmid maintenance system antidote protein VapI
MTPHDELVRRCSEKPKKVVAIELGIAQTVLSSLLSGNRAISKAMAKKLGYKQIWVKDE